MKNKRVRFALMEYNLTHYELAKLLGVSEMTLYRRLREQLPEDEQDRIVALIERAGGETDEETI